jgi:two-component sensor histidine kinase
MGMYSGIEGVRLDEIGLNQAVIGSAYQTKLPASEEVGHGTDSAVVIRCLPLTDQAVMTGAVALVRDVSDLRRRDRLLLSKDAAIREVHHRVKNNLQTISSLLRLQARRMPEGEGRHALQEADRRVRSIALVHEILSRDTTDEVDFNDILPSLIRMAEDLGSPHRPVRITVNGEAGELQAAIATPLAVVVNELLQNAAEHAFPVDEGADPSVPHEAIVVHVDLARRGRILTLRVSDNGIGLPPGFSVEHSASLGLSIVRSLVNTQMGGKISMQSDDGTVVELRIPVDAPVDDLESI